MKVVAIQRQEVEIKREIGAGKYCCPCRFINTGYDQRRQFSIGSRCGIFRKDLEHEESYGGSCYAVLRCKECRVEWPGDLTGKEVSG
jgi:hypothetical protein